MYSSRLDQLPAAPKNKTGWPWTEGSEQFPHILGGNQLWPKVSVVTPSLNQAEYLEETIRSVLLQGYPHLEYIVIDGGSTDGSIEILQKYEPWLTYWISEPDRGQSHAINKGFKRASGKIFAYLNSDDIYFPGAIELAAAYLMDSHNDLVIGSVDRVEIRQGKVKFIDRLSPKSGPSIHTFPIFSNGRVESFQFVQPSMFWKSSIWQLVGEFDERYHYSLDKQWCIRCLARGAKVFTTDKVLARFALHSGSKTQANQANFLRESIRIYEDFSSAPEFRWLPCLLESGRYSLFLIQDVLYQRSDQQKMQGEKLKAFITLLSGRSVRRVRLGLNGLANVLRNRALSSLR